MMNSRPTKKPESSGALHRLSDFVARIIANRIFLLACSFVIAVIAWALLVASDGTLTRQKVFSAASVSVNGSDLLKTRGYIVTDDLSELIPSVRLTVEVAQSSYSRVTAASYNPHIDLSAITGEGECYLPIACSTIYGPVTSCDPAGVTLHVERYITRHVPVVIDQCGTLAEGCFLDSARTEPTTLSVSGPVSLVSNVSRAVVSLDLGTLSAERMSDKSALPIVLQDFSGQSIESRLLSVTNQTIITESVVVETELIPMKKLPVERQTLVSGEPAEGYELYDVVPVQETVNVAATPETLEASQGIVADQPLDITGASEDVTGFVRLRRIVGAKNSIPLELEVTAKLRERTIERTFRSVDVELDGLGADYKATLSGERMTVQLTGGYHFINSLSREDIRLFVDVSDLGMGKYDLPVQIRIDNAENFSCALGMPELTVNIRAK